MGAALTSLMTGHAYAQVLAQQPVSEPLRVMPRMQST